MDEKPSVPPDSTWPMVAYKFVNELPLLVGIIGCVCLAGYLASKEHHMEGALEAVGAVVAALLYKGKPQSG